MTSQPPYTPRQRFMNRHAPLMIILPIFIVLTLIYAWATPPFEASDELWHFGMVNRIAETWTLPVQDPDVETAWEQEGSQPPLYYFIAAALVAPIDRSDFDALRQPNPHAKAGVPGDSDNKNLVLHDTPHPPLEKTVLAVYVVRLFSILLGCVTIFAVYSTALEFVYNLRSVAILTAGLTAFNPMFLFITASVNNDNLVIALNSLIIWQFIKLARLTTIKPWRLVLLAVLITLASLSKLSGLVLIPVLAMVALAQAAKYINRTGDTDFGQQFRHAWILFPLILIPVWLVIAGWWYLRNLSLYGELFGTQTMVAVAGPRLEPFTLQTALNEFEGFRIAYWGLFGGVNILTTDVFYLVMDGVTLAGMIGTIVVMPALWKKAWAKEGSRHSWTADFANFMTLSILGATITLGFGAFIAWTAQTYASQGRLLFPFVGAISVVLAFGVIEIIHRIMKFIPAYKGTGVNIQMRWQIRFAYGFSFALALFAFIVPFASIAPQYTPPPPLNAPPDNIRPVYADFGDVTLIGYEAPDRRYQPGEQVPVTVYWQVDEQSDRDLSLYLHAVDAAGEVIGKIDSFPGAGRLRATTWQPGAIYADSYRIPLAEDIEGRFNLRVQVGWWHYATEAVLQPFSEDGELLGSVMLDVGAFGTTQTVTQPEDMIETERINFGGAIELMGYQLDGDLLTLAWAAAGTLDDNYTIFVQVLDTDDNIVAQGDAPPTLPTHYWQRGESFLTQHPLNFTTEPVPGGYHVLVGWYRPSDFARLEANFPNDAYPLMTITQR